LHLIPPHFLCATYCDIPGKASEQLADKRSRRDVHVVD
jgi:hypothetical protein